MASEKKLQSEILKWLRSKGAYCIKTQPGGGTPVGCPDIICLNDNKWLAIEVKAEESSRNQPLQTITQDRLRVGNRWVFRAYPENWLAIKQELEKDFFN